MQVQRISFTGENKSEQSSLYSKRGYMSLANAARFIEGTFAGFAILESIDKFELVKNKKNLPAKTLKAKAWKHTKWNMVGGVATGIATVFIGKVMDKKLIPWAERISDAAEKQRAINEKAKELVEQEKTVKIEKPKELAEQEKTVKNEAKKAE